MGYVQHANQHRVMARVKQTQAGMMDKDHSTRADEILHRVQQMGT